MSRAFVAVASADHVTRGQREGFMQVCHGKAPSLRRLRAGDRIAYYSPTRVFGEGPPLRCFTGLGIVADDVVRQVDEGGGFRPWRRAVTWLPGREAPIAPLLDALSLTAGRRHWGARLRFGLVEVAAADLDRIAAAMGVIWPPETVAA